MHRAHRGEIAAQQGLEIMVRRGLDPLLIPHGFMLDPRPGCRDGRAARRGHSVVFHAERNALVASRPHLRGGLVGLLPCVDIWIHDEAETGRLHAETPWRPSLRARSHDRVAAIDEIAFWLADQLRPQQCDGGGSAASYRPLSRSM